MKKLRMECESKMNTKEQIKSEFWKPEGDSPQDSLQEPEYEERS